MKHFIITFSAIIAAALVALGCWKLDDSLGWGIISRSKPQSGEIAWHRARQAEETFRTNMDLTSQRKFKQAIADLDEVGGRDYRDRVKLMQREVTERGFKE